MSVCVYVYVFVFECAEKEREKETTYRKQDKDTKSGIKVCLMCFERKRIV